MAANNAAGCYQLVLASSDINNNDWVTQLHFGSTAVPLGNAPSANQTPKYVGGSFTWVNPIEASFGWGLAGGALNTGTS